MVLFQCKASWLKDNFTTKTNFLLIIVAWLIPMRFIHKIEEIKFICDIFYLF